MEERAGNRAGLASQGEGDNSESGRAAFGLLRVRRKTYNCTMKPKPHGTGLNIRTFEGKDGSTYLVFRTPRGAFHIFRELNARDAAADAFGLTSGTTYQRWRKLWDSQKP